LSDRVCTPRCGGAAGDTLTARHESAASRQGGDATPRHSQHSRHGTGHCTTKNVAYMHK
jgi:hypothetical protein